MKNDKSALPYLPENGYYKNLNKFEFEVPKDDIDLSTERMHKAINRRGERENAKGNTKQDQ